MKELTEKIEAFIKKEAQNITLKDEAYKYKYEYLKSMLKDMIDEAKTLKEDMSENGLTASTIEAEGFLRFALNVEGLLKET